jgi:hypothetical protein
VLDSSLSLVIHGAQAFSTSINLSGTTFAAASWPPRFQAALMVCEASGKPLSASRRL